MAQPSTSSTSEGRTGARPSGRGTLSQEVILDAAVRVVDESGLHNLSMRRLGAALGVDAMSIYGYFADKAALVEAMVDREARRLREHGADLTAPPVEIIVHIALHWRRTLLEHPGLAATVASRPLISDAWEEQSRFGLQLIAACGVSDEDVPVAAEAIINFALGSIVHEAGAASLRAQFGEHREVMRRRLARRHADLDPTSPEARTFERRIAELDGEDTGGETLERGLRALLAGLRSG